MQDANSKYKLPARLLHWGMALLMLGLVPAGFLMLDESVSRALRNTLFVAHKNVGVLMLILIAIRLIYRWRNPPQLAPIALPAAQAFAAKLTHMGLYALLVVMPLSGYVRVRAGGFPIEALDALGVPALVPRSDALAAFAKTAHLYGAYALVVLMALHIGAAAYHGLVKRDGLVSRMWPVVSRAAQ